MGKVGCYGARGSVCTSRRLCWMSQSLLGGLELAHITALSPKSVMPNDAPQIIAVEGLKLLALAALGALVVWSLNMRLLREFGVLRVKEKARLFALISGAFLVGVVIFGSVRGLNQYQNGKFMFQQMAARREQRLQAEKAAASKLIAPSPTIAPR